MSALGEIDAMKVIADALEELEDEGARDRVVRWAWSRYSQQARPAPGSPSGEPSRKRLPRSRAKKKTTRPSPSIVKDLNLRAEGSQSFRDFARGKGPSMNLRKKCTVAVYYLSRVLDLARINTNHVYTCFKDMKWRPPADLHNTLQETASRHGWLDTSDMENIALTPIGETMVEHDLPQTSADGDSR
jgi:hypothetical protein